MVTWRPVFSLPGERRSIRPEMMAHCGSVRFISADFGSQASRSSPSMSSSNSSASDSLPGADGAGEIAEAPDGQRIVGGDEAERAEPRPLEPAGEQHAERLVGEPALEGIADEVALGAARKGLDQQLAAAAAPRERRCWMPEPVAHLVGQRRPRRGSRDQVAHARRRDRSRAETCRPHRPGSCGSSAWARET